MGSIKERSVLGINSPHVLYISGPDPFSCPLTFNNNGAVTFLMIIKILAGGKVVALFVMCHLKCNILSISSFV